MSAAARLGGLAVAASLALPVFLGAQTPPAPVSGRAVLAFEAFLPQGPDDVAYSTDGLTTGIAYLSGHFPITDLVAVEAEIPFLNFAEQVNGCLDANCPEAVHVAKLGNPRVGVSVRVPSTPIELRLAQRLRHLSVQPFPATTAGQNGKRMVEQMAVRMALDAALVDRWEAFQPGLASTSLVVQLASSIKMLRLEIGGGALWLQQQRSPGYGVVYLKGDGIDLVHGTGLESSFMGLTLGAIHSGRYAWSRRADDDQGHALQHDPWYVSQLDLIAAHQFRHLRPQITLRLPFDDRSGATVQRALGISLQQRF